MVVGTPSSLPMRLIQSSPSARPAAVAGDARAVGFVERGLEDVGQAETFANGLDGLADHEPCSKDSITHGPAMIAGLALTDGDVPDPADAIGACHGQG